MDKDVFDRDIGIAFLKAINKLRADVICILHPMSYLIKHANFKRLKSFFKNYTLKRAFVFPSYLFKWTSSNLSFPIVLALYVRDQKGFSWENLLNFSFEFLDNPCTFKLSEIKTTDHLVKSIYILSLLLFFCSFGFYISCLRSFCWNGNNIYRLLYFEKERNWNRNQFRIFERI